MIKDLSIAEAIEIGKQIIADWQWAYSMGDNTLCDRYTAERQRFERNILTERGEDFAAEYFAGVNA